MNDILKKLGAILALSLCFLLPATAATKMVSVGQKEATMRSGAGTKYKAMWKLAPGYPLRVMESRGPWYKVRDFENDVGWVYRPLTRDQAHHVVKARSAALRKGPSARSGVVGKAAYGEVLRTLEHRREWVKVRRENGVTGWVLRKSLWGW